MTVDRAALDACVHCGLCLAACPTYVELGNEADSPRGRIQLVRGLVDGTLEPTREVTRHLDLCLGCRACETACPSGVAYGRIIEEARAMVEPARTSLARRARGLLARVLTTTPLREALFAPARALAGSPMTKRLPVVRWAGALRRRRMGSMPRVLDAEGKARGTALLLTGCVAETLFHDTNVATARVLARAGVRVLTSPTLGCCGALEAHLGAPDRATHRLGHVVREFVASGADWLVTNAAGCGAQVKGVERALPDERDAARVMERTRDVLELLSEVGLPPARHAISARVAVHDPCHLAHGQGVHQVVRDLLATIPGTTLVDLVESDWCCGSAGTYNLTEPGMAARLAERKLGHVRRSGATIVAAANPGCLLQLRAGAARHGLDVEFEHPIDLLARAQGVDAPAR